jgi:hypothetical protein
MEACTGAHHWARLFRQHGHTAAAHGRGVSSNIPTF